MSFTAAAIAELAFQAMLKTGASKLADKFTEAAIQKMGELRRAIVDRLKGRSPKVDDALARIEAGESEALPTLVKNLDVVMDEDPDFAQALQSWAVEINAGKKEDYSSMTMNVTGDHATGTQIKNEVENYGGKNFIGTNSVTVNHNYQGTPDD